MTSSDNYCTKVSTNGNYYVKIKIGHCNTYYYTDFISTFNLLFIVTGHDYNKTLYSQYISVFCVITSTQCIIK